MKFLMNIVITETVGTVVAIEAADKAAAEKAVQAICRDWDMETEITHVDHLNCETRTFKTAQALIDRVSKHPDEFSGREMQSVTARLDDDDEYLRSTIESAAAYTLLKKLKAAGKNGIPRKLMDKDERFAAEVLVHSELATKGTTDDKQKTVAYFYSKS